MLDFIQIEKNDDTIIVRFARPEIRSPLSLAVLSELENAVAECQENSEIKIVVFTGIGDVFASGADLREIAELTADAAPDFARRGQNLMSSIADLPQTTIAAINGFCFGGALDLALACDMRIASPTATFAHPGAGLGIITGWGGTQRLPRLIGRGNSLEMFFTASPIGATRALQIGLIDHLCENPLERATMV